MWCPFPLSARAWRLRRKLARSAELIAFSSFLAHRHRIVLRIAGTKVSVAGLGQIAASDNRTAAPIWLATFVPVLVCGGNACRHVSVARRRCPYAGDRSK